MIEEAPFHGHIKLITHHYGISNDPAASDFVTDPWAPKSARMLLLQNPRFITSGSATFFVGRPVVGWGGAQFEVGVDTDMSDDGDEEAEVWISVGEVIAIVEEVERQTVSRRSPRRG